MFTSKIKQFKFLIKYLTCFEKIVPLLINTYYEDKDEKFQPTYLGQYASLL